MAHFSESAADVLGRNDLDFRGSTGNTRLSRDVIAALRQAEDSIDTAIVGQDGAVRRHDQAPLAAVRVELPLKCGDDDARGRLAVRLDDRAGNDRAARKPQLDVRRSPRRERERPARTAGACGAVIHAHVPVLGRRERKASRRKFVERKAPVVGCDDDAHHLQFGSGKRHPRAAQRMAVLRVPHHA